MIDFKKNVTDILPYNRQRYVEFLDAEFNPSVKWHGVSFQLPGVSEGKQIGLTEFVEIYGDLFRNVLIQLDSGSFWIVNHEDKDIRWFPNERDNLIRLRTLFKERNVPNTFIGALTFTVND